MASSKFTTRVEVSALTLSRVTVNLLSEVQIQSEYGKLICPPLRLSVLRYRPI